MERIYFDNGSTSFPKAPGVSDAMKTLIDTGAFNINRGGYEGAYQLAGVIFETRQMLADLFGGKSSKQVVFTPNITYSLNYIIKGWLKSGDHVIVSSMEHNAVMRPLRQMEAQGVTFDAAQADNRGVLDPQAVRALLKPNTKAVIMTAASNVCGTCLPIAEVGKICREAGIAFILDSAQMAGPFRLNMEELGVTTLTFTGHKGLLGPQGIGGMLLDEKMAMEMDALISGGTGSLSDSEEVPQFLPDKFESGTMNLPGIVGLHAALEYHASLQPGEILRRELELTQAFLDGAATLPDTRIVGLPGTEGRAAIVSLDFLKKDNAEVAFLLDSEYGVMTRCGMHCAPRAHKSLETYPQGTVRFAFSHCNTEDEVRRCIEALHRILAK